MIGSFINSRIIRRSGRPSKRGDRRIIQKLVIPKIRALVEVRKTLTKNR